MMLRVLFSLVVVGFPLVLRAADPVTTTVPKAEMADYARQAEAELRQDILPFWLKYTRDRERGGFYGEIDGNLKVKRDAPRGALLTARILWTFSAAYRRYHDPEYLSMARWAYDDLLQHFWDPENGGVYWLVSASAQPIDRRKVAYVQSFAMYGLSEYFRASGERGALDKAVEIYRLFQRHGLDREHGGYFEEYSREWQPVRAGTKGRTDMTPPGEKSQNTHLHLLEAFTNLYRVWPDTGLKTSLRDLTEVMFDRVLDGSTHHLRLFTGEDWSPRSDTVSFGHDIEFSWLLMETVEVLGDEALIQRAKAEAVKVAAVTLAQGVDPDGGVLGEAGPKGLTVTFKEWWPQAEATVGFLNAYQLSGDPKYFEASRHSWSFIETKLVDHKNGEWLHGVSRDGRRQSTLKVGFWKCPYHNSRACMELVGRLHRLLEATP